MVHAEKQNKELFCVIMGLDKQPYISQIGKNDHIQSRTQ